MSSAEDAAECEAIHAAADSLRMQADRAEHKGRSVLLSPAEVHAIAALMLDLAGGDDQGVPNPLAVDVARAVLGEAL